MTQSSLRLPAATACLSEDDVLAFAAGRLSSSERQAADAHFDDCELCRALLEEAVRALATAPTEGLLEQDEVAWRATFRPGTVVGQRYQIRRFIARGGMGEVYEAFDQELRLLVALKTVTSTSCDNPSAVRRLKAEVQLARRVSHPSVCRIYDFGTHLVATTGAQISFLTMEFVEGETLGQRVRREGALPIEQTQLLARQLLLGLSAAHDAGVLHRDFKSDNVILRRDASGERAVILDFGLARTLEQEAPPSSSALHGLVGTLAYLAPEQLEGNSYSTASDLYSFGLVWFEMLTGQLPFKAGSSPARTTVDRLTRRVPAPSSSNPLVPRELDAIVLGCLRRVPSERFQTASEVLRRLELGSTGRAIPKRALAIVALSFLGLATAGYLTLATRDAAPTPVPAVPEAALPAPAAPAFVGQAVEPAVQLATPQPAPASPAARVGARESAPRAATTRPATVRKPQQQKQKPTLSVDSKPEPVPPAPPPHGWENPFDG